MFSFKQPEDIDTERVWEGMVGDGRAQTYQKTKDIQNTPEVGHVVILENLPSIVRAKCAPVFRLFIEKAKLTAYYSVP